jgi:enamine deaminase RidA (YjgF/YER057c/UK114 family)
MSQERSVPPNVGREGAPTAKQMIAAGAWPERYTFSPAVRAGNLLFIAGTTATDENNALVGAGDIVAQTRYIYQKFAKLLAVAGASLKDVVETTEYITTTENYRGTADVRREVFKGAPYPTATGVIVNGLLREGALIEISAIAVIPERAEAGAERAADGAERAGDGAERGAEPRPGDRLEAP